MAKAKPVRIAGAKKIEEYEVSHEAGRTKVRVYMLRGREPVSFACASDDPECKAGFDIDEEFSIEEAKQAIGKKIKDVTAVKWEDYYYVTFSADWRPIPKGLDDTDGHRGLDTFDMALKVEFVQLGEGPAGKCHRFSKTMYSSGDTSAREGWPPVGIEEKSKSMHWYKGKEVMPVRALVKVTPDNKLAVARIADGFRDMAVNLQKFLSPEVIEKTMLAALTLPNYLALTGPKGES